MKDDILILTNDENKKCKHCGRVLPVSHFYSHKRTNDGYQSWCIDCMREYNHQRYIYRASRRIGILHQDISTVLDTLKTLNKGELTDARIVFEKALEIINSQIKIRKS